MPHSEKNNVCAVDARCLRAFCFLDGEVHITQRRTIICMHRHKKPDTGIAIRYIGFKHTCMVNLVSLAASKDWVSRAHNFRALVDACSFASSWMVYDGPSCAAGILSPAASMPDRSVWAMGGGARSRSILACYIAQYSTTVELYASPKHRMARRDLFLDLGERRLWIHPLNSCSSSRQRIFRLLSRCISRKTRLFCWVSVAVGDLV